MKTIIGLFITVSIVIVSLLGCSKPKDNTAEIEAKQKATCIDNLAQIEAAKELWALENKKVNGDVPDKSQLDKYLKNPNLTCPSGGVYNYNVIGTNATCTIPGHVFVIGK